MADIEAWRNVTDIMHFAKMSYDGMLVSSFYSFKIAPVAEWIYTRLTALKNRQLGTLFT